MGKKWLTEEQICDIIEKSNLPLIESWYSAGPGGHWYREREIAYGLRPDFAFYGRTINRKKPLALIVEVKIHADAESVAQIANYAWLMKKHTYDLSPTIISHNLLIARSFDKAAYSLAAMCGVELHRFKPTESNGINLDYEDHPYGETPVDKFYSALLKKELCDRCEVEHGTR